MKRIGVFSGSFNPVHAGHLILANYVCEFTDMDEVWFVVSPQNPLKKADDLLPESTRLEMVRLALEEFGRMRASDVEFGMPRPSYTADTLAKLSAEHPGKEFSLIVGGDNWSRFSRWKEHERLLRDYQVLVYPRLGAGAAPDRESVRLMDAPVVEISSTFIRESIRNGKNVRAFLPSKVYDFIVRNGLYGLPVVPDFVQDNR
jgi:nicotinate-nucleotide adenylyltransferase